MSRINFCLVSVIALFVCPQIRAIDGALISFGTGMDNSLIQSKSSSGSGQSSFGFFWNSETNFEHGLFGYGELEYEFYYSQVSEDQEINIIAFRPVLNFWESTAKERNWYWQFGVGISYFDSKILPPIELSTNGQFATILGIGMPLDKGQQHRLTLRYNHYSNGYLETPNQGLDTISLDWHARF
ncbi:MAG: acyloxyacyl hydrolase [Kangiellaceae bacterium]|nr:acyloxyacyl hydrolase [Kangiellaceae bacterium]MCW8998272.1 acyloxyacyl hydrolase [Kangiellaceae bacterium]